MRITANQVTMARIFLLPLPVYLLIYGETVARWIAFAIFVLLGATDFVDGLMARREGPTRLGSLIDPVADKIFVAAIILSMVAIGAFPSWVATVLLSRELLMTSLRSSVAIRKEAIKTSMLAKLKTIIQMGGLGTIFFTMVLPDIAVIYVCLLLSLPFFAVDFISRLKRRKAPFWGITVALAFVLVAVIEYFFNKEINLIVQMGIILTITWVSAIDYLIGSYRLFRKTGMMHGDWIRLLWAITHGIFVVPLVAYYPIMVLPVWVSNSLEFGLGGIDNIVVAVKDRFFSWPFLISSINGLLFASLINGMIYFEMPLYALSASLLLMSVSVIVCGVFFGRQVDLFKNV